MVVMAVVMIGAVNGTTDDLVSVMMSVLGQRANAGHDRAMKCRRRRQSAQSPQFSGSASHGRKADAGTG